MPTSGLVGVYGRFMLLLSVWLPEFDGNMWLLKIQHLYLEKWISGILFHNS